MTKPLVYRSPLILSLTTTHVGTKETETGMIVPEDPWDWYTFTIEINQTYVNIPIPWILCELNIGGKSPNPTNIGSPNVRG